MACVQFITHVTQSTKGTGGEGKGEKKQTKKANWVSLLLFLQTSHYFPKPVSKDEDDTLMIPKDKSLTNWGRKKWDLEKQAQDFQQTQVLKVGGRFMS